MIAAIYSGRVDVAPANEDISALPPVPHYGPAIVAIVAGALLFGVILGVVMRRRDRRKARASKTP